MPEINTSAITFEPLEEADLLLLHKWFQVDYLKKWYAKGETYTFDMIEEKYLPRIKAPEKIASYIIMVDNNPIGYFQYYHLDAPYYPEGITDYSHVVFKTFPPEEIAGMDVFIADPNYLNKGYSKSFIEYFIDKIMPEKFNYIVVDPSKNNIIALSAFYKIGFKDFIISETQNILIYTINNPKK